MSKKQIIFDENEEDGIRSVQFGKTVVDIDIFQELDFVQVSFPTIEGESAIERDNRFWDWYARRISGIAKVPVSRPAVQRLWQYLNGEAKTISDFFFPKLDSSTDSGKTPEPETDSAKPTAS